MLVFILNELLFQFFNVSHVSKIVQDNYLLLYPKRRNIASKFI